MNKHSLIAEDINQQFNEDIRLFFSGLLKKTTLFLGLPTNPYLIKFGINEDVEIKLHTGVLSKKKAKHNLSLDNLLNLPRKINNPLIIAPHNTNEVTNNKIIIGRLSVFVEDENNEGLLVIGLSVWEDGKAELTEISTIHGRSDSQIIRAISNCLYCDYKKIAELHLHFGFNCLKSLQFGEFYENHIKKMISIINKSSNAKIKENIENPTQNQDFNTKNQSDSEIGSVKRGGRFTKNHFATNKKNVEWVIIPEQAHLELSKEQPSPHAWLDREPLSASKLQKVKLRLRELEADSEIELLELDSSSYQQYNSFEDEIFADLMKGAKHNKISIEKRAKTYGVTDKNNAKELTELAIVNVAREIIKTNPYPYEKLVELYYNQPNLSHRTSNSIILNQYSTPVPIAYLAGLYVNKWYVHEQYFEPTAGNGLLTIALPKSKVIVNELDKFRYSNLKKQQYSADFNIDAISLCKQFQSDKSGLFKFTGIVANPPFDTLEKALEVDGFVIRKLEHLIAIYALKTMLDNGKASIIVGGHTEYESERRGFDKQYFVKKGADRYFLNYLYHHYNVEDIINIDGHALYSRQGTSINTRLILINGRKKVPEGFATKTHPELSDVVTDFYELEKRVIKHIKTNQN